jgi:sucrose-6-phosphate hydrolase SacC (GH32 family)
VLPDARKAQFYGSTDLKAWTLLSEFEAPFEGQGIWECPDLLRVPMASTPLQPSVEGESVWLFKVDVFGGHPSGGTGARVFSGHFDGTRFTADPQPEPLWADWGADFYAALSWADVPGADESVPRRALWLAWMNCHRYAKHLPTSPWRGAMSVPRELGWVRTEQGWRLLQQPVRELQRLRGAVQRWKGAVLREQVVDLLPAGADGMALDIEFDILGCTRGRCGLRLRVGPGEFTEVGYDADLGTVYVDRSNSGFQPPDDPLYGRRHAAPVAAPSGSRPLSLRILLDGCLLEVFANDGLTAISEQIFPGTESTGVQQFAQGGEADFSALRLWPMAAAL